MFQFFKEFPLAPRQQKNDLQFKSNLLNKDLKLFPAVSEIVAKVLCVGKHEIMENKNKTH